MWQKLGRLAHLLTVLLALSAFMLKHVDPLYASANFEEEIESTSARSSFEDDDSKKEAQPQHALAEGVREEIRKANEAPILCSLFCALLIIVGLIFHTAYGS